MSARDDFEQGLFNSAHEALTFAYRFSTQQYALSPMAKLAQGGAGSGIGSGKGLVALDGAGQAGLVLLHVARLPLLQQACIVARYAPRYEECPCCKNQDKMTDAYREAVAMLSEWALGTMSGMSVRNMRGAIIRAFYEKGISIVAAAKELNVAKATAYDQKAKIFAALTTLDLAALAAIEGMLSEMCASSQK